MNKEVLFFLIELVGNIYEDSTMLRINVIEGYFKRKGIKTYAARTGGIKAKP